MLDGVPHKAIFASAQVARLDRPVTVLSILPVQSELGALEVAAQADLVRVLTHEIMNSLTPVTSLARSSADMVAAAEEAGADLADARSRDRNRRAPGRRHPALRRKLSRVRAGAGSPPPLVQGRSPGPRRSCASRWPAPAIARSTPGSRSSPSR